MLWAFQFEYQSMICLEKPDPEDVGKGSAQLTLDSLDSLWQAIRICVVIVLELSPVVRCLTLVSYFWAKSNCRGPVFFPDQLVCAWGRC